MNAFGKICIVKTITLYESFDVIVSQYFWAQYCKFNEGFKVKFVVQPKSNQALNTIFFQVTPFPKSLYCCQYYFEAQRTIYYLSKWNINVCERKFVKSVQRLTSFAHKWNWPFFMIQLKVLMCYYYTTPRLHNKMFLNLL